MRFREFINEAKGLFGRRTGDIFIHDDGTEASFQQVQMFPSDISGEEYASFQDAQKVIVKLEKKFVGRIDWVNKPSAKTKAFAIATLTDPKGEKIYWGRWYDKVPSSLVSSWLNNAVPVGWKLNIKGSQKARAGLTPQDLIKSEELFPNAKKIIAMIQKNGASPEIIAGLKMAASGKMPVFKGMADKHTAVRDQIGEIVQPLALMSGLIMEDAEKARKDTVNIAWKDCTIHWPKDKNQGLLDSVFTNPATGKSIGISSKGAAGAKASVGNLYHSVIKAQEEGNTALLRKNKNAVEIIIELGTKSMWDGPLDLAVKKGLISEDLSNEIKKLKPVNKIDTNGLSREAKKVFAAYGSVPSTPGYKIGNVLLANVAKMLAEEINRDPKFSSSCLDFLNQASIVQIYTDSKVVGNDVVFTSFRSKYPPQYSGKVVIDAGKTYTSGKIISKMAFDIK